MKDWELDLPRKPADIFDRYKEKHGFDTLPLYVREGSILVLGKTGEKRTVYDWTKPENHEVRLYEPSTSSGFALYNADGKMVTTLTTTEEQGTWKVRGMDVRVRRMSRAQNY